MILYNFERDSEKELDFIFEFFFTLLFYPDKKVIPLKNLNISRFKIKLKKF